MNPNGYRDKITLFIAMGLGLGRLPFAPGTFGTFLGLPLAYGVSLLDWHWAVAAILFFIGFSIWAAHGAEKILGDKDPGSVVIDEVAGMLVTLAGLEFNFEICLAGFILFRILDIVKPFPVGWLDQRVSGGAGIVADDVAAGIMGNIILRIILGLWGG